MRSDAPVVVRPRHWIRSCAACEATGYEPYEPNPPDRSVPGWSRDESTWLMARCSSCGGTGAVPWWRAALRVPVWLWRGATFLRQQVGRRPRGESWWFYWTLNLRAAFGPPPSNPKIATRYSAGASDVR